MDHGQASAAIFLFGALLSGGADPTAAQPAEAYPARPVRMVVAWPAGGGTDVIARILCQRMGEGFGQQVVVDNRGGASTIIGTEIIARSVPDGYTMGFATSNLSVNPALYPKLPYDALQDFAPVTLVARGLYVIIVHPAVPARSVPELIALVKSPASRMNVSLAGPGTPNHLGLAQFNAMLGTSLPGISYKGAAPAVAAVVSGETQLMFISYPTVAPFAQAGRLRILAVTSAQRSAAAPDLPTAVEAGLPGFVLEEWYGIVAPARTPTARIARMNAEVRKTVAQPDIRDRLVGLGADIVAGSPEAFGAHIRAEMGRWGKVIRDAGIKAE
jgi:tripartite-type tricarboxylate transporter receptor subunit TctC